MARRRLAFIPGASVSLVLLVGALTAGVATGGGGCHAGLERDAAETTVRLVGACMDPLIARVPTGAVVTFVNADPMVHAVTGAANRWGMYEEFGEGESVAYRFTRDGVFPYFCYLHPSMVGAIVVGDGGPGGTGDSVVPVAASAAAAAATTAPSQVPTAAPTAATSPAAPASAAAVAPASTTPTSGASPTGANSLLILGLLAVLLGAGAAYGFGLVPGLPRPRTRAR